MKAKLGLVLLLVILAVMAVFVSFNMKGSSLVAEHIFVSKGVSFKSVANKMEEQGVIDSSVLLQIYARIIKADRKIKSGEYVFAPQASMREILNQITDGKVYYRKITLPEGLTTNQFIQILENEELLTGEITVEVSEGEMLPETYSFSAGNTKDSVVLQAKIAMDIVLEEAWQNRQNYHVKNPYEALVLASIIEKETGLSSERRTVASVFVNRLDIGMRLQTDPTVIYAITKGKVDLGRSLRKADMMIDSPYNTYKYKGLPPTPICNPSRASILAALDPEDTDYLYFVADGKGGHSFSHTYKEHQNRIKDWQKEVRLNKN